MQNTRFIVQTGFALVCIWMGLKFTIFVKYPESGGSTRGASPGHGPPAAI